jgi:PAS domain-containing protein
VKIAMPHDFRSRLRRYGVAPAAIAIAVLIKWSFGPLMPALFLPFFGAAAVVGWYGGLGPGLLTTALSAISTHTLFMAGTSVDSTHLLRVGLFMIAAGLLAWGASTARDNRRRLEQSESRHRELSAELERRVHERTEDLVRANLALEAQVVERRHAEDDLRESEMTMRALLDALPDLTYRVARDGTFVDFRLAKGFHEGGTAVELMGKRVAEIPSLLPHVGQDVIDQGVRALSQVFETLEPQTLEIALTVDGRLVHFENRLVPCGRDEVLAIVRNVTERKQAEQLLQQSVANFRALAETVSAAIFILREDELAYVNPAAEAITGFGRQELSHTSIWDSIHPELRALARQRGELVSDHLDWYRTTSS